MPKVRFVYEKKRTDIDFTLWGITYWDYPAMVYTSYDSIPEEVKIFMENNKPTEELDNNILSRKYGNDDDYTYESIVRGFPWENR